MSLLMPLDAVISSCTASLCLFLSIWHFVTFLSYFIAIPLFRRSSLSSLFPPVLWLCSPLPHLFEINNLIQAETAALVQVLWGGGKARELTH